MPCKNSIRPENIPANIFGIPKSSMECEKLLVPLLPNLAIDVCIGPLVASTFSFVGEIIPNMSPLVENPSPNLSLNFSEPFFLHFKRISVDPIEPAASITCFVFIVLVISLFWASFRPWLDCSQYYLLCPYNQGILLHICIRDP